MSDATMAPVNEAAVTGDPITNNAGRIWAGISRLLLGFIFLWAFLDKNFGLGYTTVEEKAWQFGTGEGNPTAGFLAFGTNPEGPFADFFTGLAPESGSAFINWLFMFALLGAGVSLMLGVFMRIACIGSGILLLSMYLAEAPWAKVTLEDGTIQASNNPLVDDHIVYSAVLLLLMFVSAGRYLGLGRLWEEKVPSFLA